MQVVAGVEALRPEHGPLFSVVGVFDGLHRGHTYLLEHLVREADARAARPTVITFDHHPDEVLLGAAPPLLLDPAERLERLAASGVAVTVVQHFDEVVRRTPYDVFVERIRVNAGLAGLLMTPDAAFGFERRGTPEALTALGERDGFDVVVVPTFTLDGRSVRSSDIRSAIATGDLRTAETLLGRPVGLRAEVRDGRIAFDWPLAMPPAGTYRCLVGDRPARLVLDGERARLEDTPSDPGPVAITLVGADSPLSN